MRHWVNFGLLYAFLTLAFSGVCSFVQPFSITTTRIHVVSAVATVILVGLHLVGRIRYFRSQLKWNVSDDSRPGRRIPKWGLGLVTLMWLMVVGLAWSGRGGTERLLSWSYEARHRAEIVRPGNQTGWLQEDGQILISRLPGNDRDTGAARLALQVRFHQGIGTDTAIAIWTESTAGSLIETLFLSPELAYSDQPTWQGTVVGREQILPIWRHRYTLVSGREPDGTIDVFSGATRSHQFSLHDYLKLGEDKSFVLCVEVNQPGDPNRQFPDPILGQPSILYTALIEMDSEQKYWLLNLTGHGGGSESSGAIQYDLDQLSTSRSLVDLILAHVER